MDKQSKATGEVTVEQRKEPTLKAVNKGNFKDYGFEFDVECYVLNDEDGTAVISQRGMATALGLRDSGSAFPEFVSSKTMSTHVGAGLPKKISNPLIFKGFPMGAGMPPPRNVHGYDVTDLIDVCNAVLTASANKELDPVRYEKVIRQAQILVTASAKSGIKGLVYAITGYNATREQVIRSFKLFVAQVAREYEREFPEQLYTEWYRLYDLKVPKRGRPWEFRRLTIEQVYQPLANSDSEIYKLLVAAKNADSKNKHKKLHQFLEKVGVVALRQHLGQLLGIARISKSRREYEKHFETLFGKGVQLTINDFFPDDSVEDGLSDFDKGLKKALDYSD